MGFSATDRRTNVLRVSWVAAQIALHGGIALCSLVSPDDKVREEARELAASFDVPFLLVHVATSLEECERRDPKALYAQARAGLRPGLTGIDSPYDRPTQPDLELDTRDCTPREASQRVLELLEQRGILTPPSASTPSGTTHG